MDADGDTCKASEMVNAGLIIKLEGAAKALGPPPVPFPLMCLHHVSQCFNAHNQRV